MIRLDTRSPSAKTAMSLRLCGLIAVVSGMLVASVIATNRSPGTGTLMASGGTGVQPPSLLSPPGTVIHLDPKIRYIVAMVTIVRPEDTVILRSPHDLGGVVRPIERTGDGLFVFTVPDSSQWLLTVTGNDVVDVPIAAGQDIQIVLP